jgi:hypothetical protein
MIREQARLAFRRPDIRRRDVFRHTVFRRRAAGGYCLARGLDRYGRIAGLR